MFYLLKEREILESQDKEASETENVHSSNPWVSHLLHCVHLGKIIDVFVEITATFIKCIVTEPVSVPILLNRHNLPLFSTVGVLVPSYGWIP